MKICISVTDLVISTDKIWTNEYKNTVHVLLQRFNASIVVALGFCPVERPEGVSTSMKIAYHVRILIRIFVDRATFARVVNYCLLPLWWLWGLHTYVRVFHALRLSVSARLNLAKFGWCWGLFGILRFGLVDDPLVLMSYAFPAFYS